MPGALKIYKKPTIFGGKMRRHLRRSRRSRKDEVVRREILDQTRNSATVYLARKYDGSWTWRITWIKRIMKHDVELNRRPNVRRTGGKQICTCSSTTSRRGSDRSLQTLKEENRGKRREGGKDWAERGKNVRGWVDRREKEPYHSEIQWLIQWLIHYKLP